MSLKWGQVVSGCRLLRWFVMLFRVPKRKGLAVYSRLASSQWSPYFYHLSAKVTSVHLHALNCGCFNRNRIDPPQRQPVSVTPELQGQRTSLRRC